MQAMTMDEDNVHPDENEDVEIVLDLEHVRHSTSTLAIDEALAKAQAEYYKEEEGDEPRLVKSKTAQVDSRSGASFSYKYADLAAVYKAIIPILANNGIGVLHTTVRTKSDGMMLYTRLICKGEWYETEWPVAVVGESLTQQKLGGNVTYGRRYSVCCLSGVAAEDD